MENENQNSLDDWRERTLQHQREKIQVYEVKEWGARKVCIARNTEEALYEARALLERGDFGVTIHKGSMHPDKLAKLEVCKHGT